MKVKGSLRTFSTPIIIGNPSANPDSIPLDEQVNTYLAERRKRRFEEAKQAELERVAEEEKTEAARQRKERELIEGGKISPMGNKEEDMETTDKKVEDAAEVAAEAASAGVGVGEAKDLGTGKKRVVVIKPGSKETPTEDRWTVIDGKPERDPDGEYATFAQAYKVAALGAQAAAVAADKKNNPMAFLEFLKTEGLLGGKTDSFTQDLAKRYLDNIDNQLRSAAESKGKTPAEVEVLRGELASLREEIKRSSDPIESAKRVKGIFDALRDAGVIPEPTTSGEPIEHLKEKHRHEEKMKEIAADSEYKTTISKTLGEIPERVGRGIAAQIAGEEEGESEEGSSFPTFSCECGHKIVVPPEAGETISCGKCGAIYARKETKQPESSKPKVEEDETSEAPLTKTH